MDPFAARWPQNIPLDPQTEALALSAAQSVIPQAIAQGLPPPMLSDPAQPNAMDIAAGGGGASAYTAEPPMAPGGPAGPAVASPAAIPSVPNAAVGDPFAPQAPAAPGAPPAQQSTVTDRLLSTLRQTQAPAMAQAGQQRQGLGTPPPPQIRPVASPNIMQILNAALAGSQRPSLGSRIGR